MKSKKIPGEIFDVAEQRPERGLLGTASHKKIWTPKQREMLFRKNDGKIRYEQYLQKLSAFFATPVQPENLLGLEETDAIVQKERTVLQQQQWISINHADMHALYPASTNYTDVFALYPSGWDYMETQQMLAFMQGLLEQQSCYFYWCRDSHYCGMYQTNIDMKINLDYDFAKHKPDDIWLYAVDDDFRFHLEYCHDEVIFDDLNQRHIRVRLVECTYTMHKP